MEPRFYIAKLNRKNGTSITISSEDEDVVDRLFLERRHGFPSQERIVSIEISYVDAMPQYKIKAAFDRLAHLIENGLPVYHTGPFGRVEKEEVFLRAAYLELEYIRLVKYVPEIERQMYHLIVDAEADSLVTLAPGIEYEIDEESRDEFMDNVSIVMKALRILTKKVFVPKAPGHSGQFVYRFGKDLNYNARVKWVRRLQSLIESQDFYHMELEKLEEKHRINSAEILNARKRVKQEPGVNIDSVSGITEEEYKEHMKDEAFGYRMEVMALNRRQINLGLDDLESRSSLKLDERRCNIL